MTEDVRRIVWVLMLVACGIAASGCDRALPSAATPPPTAAAPSATVYTTFYPTTYFATRLGAGVVDVHCPLPEGADPADWQPDAATIAKYQSAGLIVFNGADFESWRKTASLPESRVVDSARPFRAEFLRFKGHTHSHGPGGEHTHAGIDGHTWLDPINAKAQASEIAAAMTKQWPQSGSKVGANLAALLDDLDALDAKLKGATPTITGVVLIASHPAYNYLARRYGWTVHDVDLPPDVPPTDKAWAEMAAKAKSGRTIILFEEEPCKAMLDRVTGDPSLRAVVFEPCESTDERGDYLTRMNQNIDRLAAAAGGS